MATPQDDERAETSEATYQGQDDGHGQSRKNTVLPRFTDLPRADAYRRIDFERVEVRPGVAAGTYILVVSGTAPYANMRVELVPLVYVRRPKYWGIEVVGSLPGGIGLPAEAPYTVSLPLDGFV